MFKMLKEKNFRLFIIVVTLGSAIVSFLAALLHNPYVIVLTVLSIILLILSFKMDSHKFVLLTEKLEIATFFFTLIMIILSFIYLFKPIN